MMQSAFAAQSGASGSGGLEFLDGNESKTAARLAWWSARRPWKSWVRGVEAGGLYLHSA